MLDDKGILFERDEVDMSRKTEFGIIMPPDSDDLSAVRAEFAETRRQRKQRDHRFLDIPEIMPPKKGRLVAAGRRGGKGKVDRLSVPFKSRVRRPTPSQKVSSSG